MELQQQNRQQSLMSTDLVACHPTLTRRWQRISEIGLPQKWNVRAKVSGAVRHRHMIGGVNRFRPRVIFLSLSALFMAACSASSSTTATTVPTPITTTTEVNLAPTLEDLTQAKVVWAKLIQDMPNTIMDAGVGVSKDRIIGSFVDSSTSNVEIWMFDSGDFVKQSAFRLNDFCCSPTQPLVGIQMVDINADGSDDLFVQESPNHVVGYAISEITGVWSLLKFDGVESVWQGSLKGSTVEGYERVCMPSCAEGDTIPISYEWDGTEFKGKSIDNFGSTFSLIIGPNCTNFTKSDYEPFKICDKGNSIKYFQKVLASHGLLYSSKGDGIDGYFGPELEYSVKVVQYRWELPVTGTIEGEWYRSLIETYNISNGYGG